MLSRLRDIGAQIVGGEVWPTPEISSFLPFHAQKTGVVDRLQVDRSPTVSVISSLCNAWRTNTVSIVCM